MSKAPQVFRTLRTVVPSLFSSHRLPSTGLIAVAAVSFIITQSQTPAAPPDMVSADPAGLHATESHGKVEQTDKQSKAVGPSGALTVPPTTKSTPEPYPTPVLAAAPSAPAPDVAPPGVSRLTGAEVTLPKSLLKENRIVSYYGLPGAPGMGILGQLEPQALLDSIRARAADYQALSDKPVLPAFEIVVAQAMREPQRDNTHRRRLNPATIAQYVDFAGKNGIQVILDVQPGWSSLKDEIEVLKPFLRQPHVHLAFDAEYIMPAGVVPGTALGTVDAASINEVTHTLAEIVKQYKLPNKIFMIHTFRSSMITNVDAIKPDPRVDFVANVDGIGPKQDKINLYKKLLPSPSIAYPGFQIFLRHDPTPMSPAEAMGINPAPSVFVYF